VFVEFTETDWAGHRGTREWSAEEGREEFNASGRLCSGSRITRVR
jgi:hypothetical protein